MQSAPLPENEQARLQALVSCAILDSQQDPDFNNLVQLCLQLFNVPMAAITLAAENRIWFKAEAGLNASQCERDISLCGHVVYSGQPLIIEDTSQDKRFADNPLVIGTLKIGCYVGYPLFDREGFVLGVLCIMDTTARQFDEKSLLLLDMLSKQAAALIKRHRSEAELSREKEHYSNALLRYTAILQEAAAGIIRINDHGIIQSASPFILKLLGYPEQELIGKNVSCLMPDPYASEHDHYISSYLSGQRPATIIGTGRKVKALHKNGTMVSVHLAISKVEYAGSIEFIGILLDLTQLEQAEEELKGERNLLRSILDANKNPLFVKHKNGHYIVANQASNHLFSIEVDSHLENKKISRLLTEEQKAELRLADNKVLSSGVPEKLQITLKTGAVFELTKTLLRDIRQRPFGVVTVAHDITSMLFTMQQVESQQKLLEVLHRGLTDYNALMSGESLWDFLCEALRELTSSDYSLIGEVLSENNSPVLKIHSLTDLSWDEDSKTLMQQLKQGDMVLRNGNTLLGQVFAGGKTIVTNDLQNDPRRGGYPKGHPTLNNYLGVPITSGDHVIGMLAIANSSQHLDQKMVQWLKPFTATCALLIQLYRQMSERDRFTSQLARARDDAERANRAKSEFLSSMSHELRTPLNSILGFAQLLLNGKKAPLTERQYTQVQQIFKSGKHLLALINDVLDLAKIESGKVHLSIESLVVQDVVTEATDTIASIAQQHNITVSQQPPAGYHYHVKADYTRLKQVLINLLGNAVKYNRPEGNVVLSWFATEQKMLRIDVKDNGLGIAADKMPELFQPFNRLGAENSAIEGSGVGLSLTKKLIEQMNGHIFAVSEEGAGSTFSIELPLDDSSSADNLSTENLMAGLIDTLTIAVNRKSVLYIEDNPANQRLMLDIFEDFENIDLTCSHDAHLGIELAIQHQPDLIFMDINLPGMDGYQAKALLALNDHTKHIPVIGLSANAMPSDIAKSKAAGFAEYLTKPIDVNALITVVERYLETQNDIR